MLAGDAVVGSGFVVKPDKDVLIIGPTGLVLDRSGALYVSDANGNSIVTIPDAVGRKTSAGTGLELTKDGLMKRPLAMDQAPNGHLLALNGSDGRIVEVDPLDGRQVVARWINTNKAQSPPGNGNLFGPRDDPRQDGVLLRQRRRQPAVAVEVARADRPVRRRLRRMWAIGDTGSDDVTGHGNGRVPCRGTLTSVAVFVAVP